MELNKLTEVTKNLELEEYILSKIADAIAAGGIINITTDKGTASESTMGKLFIEIGPDSTGIYYTIKEGNIYKWKDMETDIFDDITIPSDVSQLTDNQNTQFTPKSHTHGNLQNDGQVGSTVQANKNVVTDSNGKITTENKITVDSVLSDSSTNPVQNKIVKESLDTKISSISIDNDLILTINY